jgi:ribosomal protein L29
MNALSDLVDRMSPRDRLPGAGAPRFTAEAVVVHGDKRGRLLGFPTANLAGDDVPLSDGVWAGTVEIVSRPGSLYAAAISLGRRPTYKPEKSERLIEAFLLDFDRDLYGELLRVQFHHRLRPQERFIDSAELVAQLRRDVARVRTWARRRGVLPRPRPDISTTNRGWGPTRRGRVKDRRADAIRRDMRRVELISQAVLACPPAEFSYAWVAVWTGLPEEYLRYHYNTLDALKRVSPERHSG